MLNIRNIDVLLVLDCNEFNSVKSELKLERDLQTAVIGNQF